MFTPPTRRGCAGRKDNMKADTIALKIRERIKTLESREDEYYRSKKGGYRKTVSKIQIEKSKLKDMLWAYEKSPYK